jgi:hypothetical protein
LWFLLLTPQAQTGNMLSVNKDIAFNFYFYFSNTLQPPSAEGVVLL